MRQINYIVLHCTATPQNTTVESIQRYWKKELGWRNPGYHYIIKPDGSFVQLLDIDKIANGVAGYNKDSIHISYIGGIDKNGNPVDNRTIGQIAAQLKLIRSLLFSFPKVKILGHRDFPGVKKDCPSFDVATWLKEVGLI